MAPASMELYGRNVLHADHLQPQRLELCLIRYRADGHGESIESIGAMQLSQKPATFCVLQLLPLS